MTTAKLYAQDERGVGRQQQEEDDEDEVAAGGGEEVERERERESLRDDTATTRRVYADVTG